MPASAPPKEAMAPTGTDETATAEVVKHIRLLHLDFRACPSATLESCLSICQSVLESGSSAEAADLWQALVTFAAELRPVGGSTDLPGTICRLCRQFHLEDYPDYERDWRHLSRVSGQAMNIVRRDIAGLTLPRDQVVEQIRDKMKSARVLVLLGESGCGKSALAKGLLEDEEFGFKGVWFNSEMLDKADMVSVGQRLDVRNSLVAVLKSASSPAALLVIDGADRFSMQALRNAASLLTELGLGEDGCRWRVIITCQPDAWDAVLRQLMAHRTPPEWTKPFVVEMPSLPEIHLFLSQFSTLRLPTLSADITPLLRNLKTLDWVVAAAVSDSNVDAKGWVGVSDVLEWIWQQWTSADHDKYAKAEALKQLANTEGETLISGMPISELGDAARSALPELEACGLLRVSNERVCFAHDLAGDWARLRVLIGDRGQLSLLRSKVRLPRWHRAIRMHAQRTLERDGDGTGQWRDVVTALDENSPDDVALRDLYLEAVVLAVNSAQLLEQTWPDLCCNRARLLHRLLRRFMHTATIPDPRITAIADTEDDMGLLAATMRVPYWPYWGPVLAFLHTHKDGLPVSVQDVVSGVCCLWLEKTPPELQKGRPWPWRREAAEVALRMAREVQAAKAERVYFEDDGDQKAYEAVLNAAPDLPDEVCELALELCCRRDQAPEITARARLAADRRRKEREEYVRENPKKAEKLAGRAASLSAWSARDWPLRKPWPDGPLRRMDSAFQKAVLQKQAITSMITVRPEIASEVILASCIQEPKPDRPFSYHDMMLDGLGTNSAPDAYPPMFFRGPFLMFLRTRPQEGLDTILRLVNFATERWMESQQKRADANGQTLDTDLFRVTMQLADGPAQWTGDERVYGWFRNHLISANLVVCALMACEKWLYDLLDTDQDVSPWISRILQRSRSLAFIGLLAEVGKKKRDLFAGPLTPLLGVWQIYTWDQHMLMNADVWRFGMASWASWGERIWNLVRDWHTMPHRKQSLQQLGVCLLLTNKNVKRSYDTARQQWAAQLQADPADRTLELLIARFDPDNYKASEGGDGKIYVGLEWPEKLRDETEAELRKSQTSMEALTFPVTCRRILDGEQELTDDELPDFWDRLRRLAEFDTSQDPDLSADRIAAAVCGGIAVLFTERKAWIEEDEERSKWCTERLSAVVAPPRPQNPLEVPQSMMTIRLDCFVAEAAVALLADTPDSRFARQLVAESIAGFYYETTGLAMRAGFRFRRELGEDFCRMQNLAVLWAALRILRTRGEVLKADLTRFSLWYDRLIRVFVQGTLPSRKMPWQRIESFTYRSLERMENRYQTRMWEPAAEVETDEDKEVESAPAVQAARRRRPIRFPGFDIQVLQPAFSWLPKLSEARGVGERQAWIETWRELLAVVLRMVGSDEMDEGGELSGTPYAYDCWVFKGVAELVPQMTPEEEPERLWQPIVELGPTAHYWVKDFLCDWTCYGPDAAESPAEFVRHWRVMIEHCLSSPTWDAKGRAGFHLDEMYIDLMGLGLGSERVGREEFAEPIGSMLDLYERWASDWLKRWHILRYLPAFLAKSGARDLVCPAIHWIGSAVEEYDDYDWRGLRQGELEFLITGALRTCWLQHRKSVRDDGTLREAFLRLLTILTNRLCPSAMELRDEVVRSLRM